MRLSVGRCSAHGGRRLQQGPGPTRRDGTKGDLIVTVDLRVPAEFDDAAREALEQLRKTDSGDDLRNDLLQQAREG